MREIVRTTQFKRDFKRVKKSGLDLAKLASVIRLLASDDTLPANLRDHALKGDWKDYRECHLAGDWLLIYQLPDDQTLLLVRTGSHSELFD